MSQNKLFLTHPFSDHLSKQEKIEEDSYLWEGLTERVTWRRFLSADDVVQLNLGGITQLHLLCKNSLIWVPILSWNVKFPFQEAEIRNGSQFVSTISSHSCTTRFLLMTQKSLCLVPSLSGPSTSICSYTIHSLCKCKVSPGPHVWVNGVSYFQVPSPTLSFIVLSPSCSTSHGQVLQIFLSTVFQGSLSPFHSISQCSVAADRNHSCYFKQKEIEFLNCFY